MQAVPEPVSSESPEPEAPPAATRPAIPPPPKSERPSERGKRAKATKLDAPGVYRFTTPPSERRSKKR
jgi:hypothetical protein